MDQHTAFTLFTEGFGRWWPVELSWSGAAADPTLGIEPGVGGKLFEIGPHGLRWDWGRVLMWEPPRSVSFTWQIGPDRVPVPEESRSSVVNATVDDNDPTAVDVRHDHWGRHGEHAAAYREAFAQTWPMALERLGAVAAQPDG